MEKTIFYIAGNNLDYFADGIYEQSIIFFSDNWRKVLKIENGIQVKEKMEIYSLNILDQSKSMIKFTTEPAEDREYDYARVITSYTKKYKDCDLKLIFYKESDNIHQIKKDKIIFKYDFSKLKEICPFSIQLISYGNSNYVKEVSDMLSENIPYELSKILKKKTRKLSVKNLLNSVIELNKRIYYFDLLPSIEKYYITDKADGLKCLLILGNKIKYWDNKLYTISEEAFGETTVIECERVGDKFLGYDLLMFNGSYVTDKPFYERLKLLRTISSPFLSIKKFVRLEKNTYKTSIREMAETKEYQTDGLIFTRADTCYAETKHYKWKPITTIDFLVKSCPKELLGKNPYVKKDTNLYLLFCGISEISFRKLNMKFISSYNKMFPHLSKYFPIQFSPSDYPNVFIWNSDISDLDGKIIELRWENEQSGQWEFVKVREDRALDIAGGYFGNDYRTAEFIWRNYKNPLTLEHLCGKDISQELYFKIEHSEIHQNIRKYNNAVKYELINKYVKEKKWVVDLACGKGQDIFKYINNRARNLLLIDINENNICAVIDRKFSYAYNHQYDKSKVGIYTQQMDLNKLYVDNLLKLDNSGIPINKIDIGTVVCNFGIHYFCETKKTIENLALFISNIMPKGSRFIFTCLDGKKVAELLDTFGEWGDGKKYFLKYSENNKPSDKTEDKDTESIKLLGKKIKILLPFSTDLQEEPLVDLSAVKAIFSRHKLSLESELGFDTFMEKIKSSKFYTGQLYEDDINYISLLSFSIYYKN
jgi:SAM-dependent methyltransferase